MRHWVFCTICIWLAAHCPASAGPWLREKGSGFVSLSYTTAMLQDARSGSYLEYGLRPGLTIGVDVSHGIDTAGRRSGTGTFFFRRALGSTEGTHRFAYDIGLGAAWGSDLILPHLKAGVSWGRGYSFVGGSGWMVIETSLTLGLRGTGSLAKLDATLGYDFNDTVSAMMQVYTSRVDGETYGTLAPSLLIRPGESDYRFQIGAEREIGGFGQTSLKFGLWRNF